MNIPYKFRGIDETGNWRYGDLIQDQICVIVDDNAKYFKVKPSSVGLLIGYDIEGNEIYEGDSVINKDGEIWTALERYSDVDNVDRVKFHKLKVVKKDVI